MSKICSKCKIEKNNDEFYIHCGQCKDCIKEVKKLYIKKNIDKVKQYHKKYRTDNKEYRTQLKKIWMINNKEKIDKYYNSMKGLRNKRQRDRYCNDALFKIRRIMRSHIKRFFKMPTYLKDKHSFEYFNCSAEEFKLYLESKFYPHPVTGEAMTWDNHGYYGWHLDHIRPVDSFDLTNPDDIKKANHYTNFQPLWAEDHKLKTKEQLQGNNYEK